MVTTFFSIRLILGEYLSDQLIKLEVRPDSPFNWLSAYMGTREGRVASVMLATQLTQFLDAEGHYKYEGNDYFTRLRSVYEHQFPVMFELTVGKISAVDMRIASFHFGDVFEWIDTLPKDKPFLFFPPLGGGMNAAKQKREIQRLNLIFDWEKPASIKLEAKNEVELLSKVTDREFWAFGTDHPIPEFAEHLTGITRTTNRGQSVYVYHSGGPKRIVTPHQEIELVNNTRLSEGMDIGDRITLSVLNYKQFQGLRSQYLNVGIRPGSASIACAVLVDGYLVGVFAYSVAPATDPTTDIAQIYMMTDFPVAPD